MKGSTRRCAHCRKKVPVDEAVMGGIKSFCSFEHLIEFTRSKPAKEIARKVIKRDTKAKLDSLKTASDYIKEAQVAFNSYIRIRDKHKQCISCGCLPGDTVRGGKFDAGHYRSRGSASHLRYHLLNCHSQCVKCNRYLSGNVVEYRKGLIARIGAERVEKLEMDNNPRKLTIDYLKRVKKIFNYRKRIYERKFR
jgi:hypothetical protein